jgi:hypothetical protein
MEGLLEILNTTSSAQLEISPVSFKFSEQEKFDD